MNENLISMPRFYKLPFNITTAGTTFPDANYSMQRDNSRILCIEYVISGCVVIENDGQKIYAQAGDTYLLPLGIDHKYYSEKNNPPKKIWVNSIGLLSEHLPQIYGLNKIKLFKSCDTSKFLYEIHNICTDPSIPYEKIQMLCAQKFFCLIQFLSRQDYQIKMASSEIEILKYYIDNHIKETIHLTDLAALIPCSVSQIMRIFKRGMNTTPYEYILSQKINMAKILMKTTNLRIKDIADELSFDDEHYFSTLFKQKIGCTPTQYKKNISNTGYPPSNQ